MKNKPDVAPEEAMKKMQKIFKERGTKALEIAREEILEEKIESKQANEALNYFITKYWNDVARPSLMELVCEAVGGKAELTTSIAVSMSLISGGIDIHDDIIDKSRSKYGRATVYGKWGKDVALLVGDALMFKGLTLLNKAADLQVPREKMGMVMDVIKNMFFELGDGEAMELQFRGNIDVSPEECLKVMRMKAADVEAHTRISAILGGASQEQVEALGRYGRLLGMLILLRDDWIDILDNMEIRRRIKQESLPLPLLYCVQNAMLNRKLKAILSKKVCTTKDGQLISRIVLKTGVRQKYAKLMSKIAEEAILKLREQKVKNENLELMLRASLIPSTEMKHVRVG